MRIIDLLALIAENLGRRKARVALTAIGVVIGTAAVVVLVSLGWQMSRLLIGVAVPLTCLLTVVVRWLMRGRLAAARAKGRCLQPTIVVDAPADARVVREEIFGPVVVATPFRSLEEIPAFANDTVYGLAASVWTQNLSAAHRLAAQIRAGTVWINCHSMYDASLPIGGMKQSGWGRDSGHQALENYLETKTVCAVI